MRETTVLGIVISERVVSLGFVNTWFSSCELTHPVLNLSQLGGTAITRPTLPIPLPPPSPPTVVRPHPLPFASCQSPSAAARIRCPSLSVDRHRSSTVTAIVVCRLPPVVAHRRLSIDPLRPSLSTAAFHLPNIAVTRRQPMSTYRANY
ncbi:hypothetical protein Droror1_Dr00010353 [Drosera rotundifolia]